MDENKVVQSCSAEEAKRLYWSHDANDPTNPRYILYSEIAQGIVVSTVFLARASGWTAKAWEDNSEPFVFETMVFASGYDEDWHH